MQIAEGIQASARPRWVDFIALGKPRLSLLVLCTAAAGLWVAPRPLAWWSAIAMLLSTAILVGSANALNSYFERSSDARMKRTRSRPLPAQLVDPKLALLGSIVLGGTAVATIALSTNTLTALLGAVAFVVYAFVYTPLKPRSSLALFVGAIPGAIPPLMGWTASMGRIDLPGLVLFGILFFWQLPHFIAISIYLGDDYERGGHRVFSNVHGEVVARWSAVVTTFALLPVTWALIPLGVVGPVFGWISVALSGIFGLWTLVGVKTMKIKRWARRIFVGSLLYLTLYLAFLVLGAHPA